MAPPANGDSVSGHQLAATYADKIKDKIILVLLEHLKEVLEKSTA